MGYPAIDFTLVLLLTSVTSTVDTNGLCMSFYCMVCLCDCVCVGRNWKMAESIEMPLWGGHTCVDSRNHGGIFRCHIWL